MTEQNQTDNVKERPFNKCAMPDLSDLSANNTLLHAVRLLSIGAGPADPQDANLARNYIRLVDQLVLEYERSRLTCLDMIDQRKNDIGDLGPIGLFFRVMGHLETTVLCLHRCLQFANCLDKRVLFSVDRQLITKEDEKRIRDFRNAIQHWDERITGKACSKEKVVLKEGDPNAMQLWIDEFELPGICIRYEELGVWIRHLHELACNLV